MRSIVGHAPARACWFKSSLAHEELLSSASKLGALPQRTFSAALHEQRLSFVAEENVVMALVLTTASPLVVAVNQVLTWSAAQVVEELNARLGLKLTAVIGGVRKTSKVAQWAKGTYPPRRLRALQAALQAACAVSSRYDNVAARAWFMSRNPALEMRSPLVFVRQARQSKDFDLLVTCAIQDVS